MKLVRVELTVEQSQRWSECKAKMQWTVPHFTHLFFRMLNPDDNDNVLYFTNDIPTLATDGKRIIANPEFFFDLTLNEQVFAVCHEIEHAFKLHMQQGHVHMRGELPVHWKGKDLPYVPMIANFAQDFVINADLIEAKIGTIKGTVRNGKCEGGWLYDTSIATSDTSWQEAYHNIWNKNPPKQGGKGGGPGDPSMRAYGAGQLDEHLPPGATSGQDPDSAEAQPDPVQWQQAVIGALAVARSAGKLPANIERMFEEFLKPVVKWTDHIEALFARFVGSSGYDYRRLDRRLITRGIGAPGKSGKGAGTIVIGVDTSGSIYAVPKLIERFFGEVSGILEDLRPKRIVLMWCDAHVHRVDDIEDPADLEKSYCKGAVGGGGTSFKPVFKEIKKMDLDDVGCLVYLTDGDGSFPSREPAGYPVIWGDISGEPKKYPWGKVVSIPNDGTA
jgi:predicted metal-dependent peptidase